MALVLQIVGLVLGLLSWGLTSSSTSNHHWKVKSQVESVSLSQWTFEGLWMSCAAAATGSTQCSRFKTVLGLPGLLSLTAVSLYASRVIQDFYNPVYPGVRFELGVALYQGWSGSGLALIGGSLLLCSVKDQGPRVTQYSVKYTSENQHIYTAPSETKAYV
ncbi:claudin-1-like isoform X2 [Boleophthalmus pectinirostris]|uniref:claudin-1-like isoform X2 n=1 Tax=Boleophthalmus pectinirostris TaxID=150288 RepID=UPI0024318264|nr:claudin-1-like isoform X2 [Boleophthalmus pectinirostris]